MDTSSSSGRSPSPTGTVFLPPPIMWNSLYKQAEMEVQFLREEKKTCTEKEAHMLELRGKDRTIRNQKKEMDRLQVCLWEEEKKKRNGGTEKDKMIEQLQSETDHLRALLKDERRRRRVERGIMKEWKAEILRLREAESHREVERQREAERSSETERSREAERATEWENQRQMLEINRLKQLLELLMVDLQLAHVRHVIVIIKRQCIFTRLKMNGSSMLTQC
ncbi:capping protein inhibiting regulator of actin dynamics-like [Salvelinus namaycush]|uniref:Capping protein inhibiting regulator of actin dynamics-like n=1 Tax=Salvelinus namaycush TaxID=8040 RepID=A0A8U0QGU6_SALNM|nr:capping protein inhibiting regulator of actin dynamics-like [Salvelinus namaycush]XP_038843055.1 capping protein inhibiting regulator of actin dynamics-like [Salvelinus namaycush]